MQNIMYDLDKLKNKRNARKKRTHPRRRDSLITNPVVVWRIGVLRCCSGVVATASTNPREPTSNHPLTVLVPSQGAPRLRTIDSHGNEGESRVARSKGRDDEGEEVFRVVQGRRCALFVRQGCSRDNDTPALTLSPPLTYSFYTYQCNAMF